MSGFIYGRQIAMFGQPPVVGFGSQAFRVEAIPKVDADREVAARHYSGSVVWSSSVHLGVFAADDLCGVLQFGVGMNPASGAKVVEGSDGSDWLELNRMVLFDNAPPQSASRAVSCAVKYLRRARPALRWIQSFADERCGKWGGVYQACSWTYLGSHETTFYLLDGEWFHKSLLGRAEVDGRGWGSGPKAARLRAGRERAVPHTFRQFRYFKALTSGTAKRLLLDSYPYPKPSADR